MTTVDWQYALGQQVHFVYADDPQMVWSIVRRRHTEGLVCPELQVQYYLRHETSFHRPLYVWALEAHLRPIPKETTP